ncbi:MAG: glycosyl hydrolase family 28-related protein, partial [Leptolyngbyaceae bacterium]|nr:glycosyl hydrolase family 28-related protein [Leptolyngbyaceae bacterium]
MITLGAIFGTWGQRGNISTVFFEPEQWVVVNSSNSNPDSVNGEFSESWESRQKSENSSSPFPEHSLTGLGAESIYGQAPATFGDAIEIVFPADPAIVLNVREFGAVGDGLADDTVAIQNAIYESTASSRALYFPNGVYRITQEIRFEQSDGQALRSGPHLYGQSRDGVILRLEDNLAAFADPGNPIQAVIRTVNAEDGATFRQISADFFNRQLVNFTIDTGNNPGAVGIKFYSNNTGILHNVRVIGNGAIGIDIASIALNGPNLMQNIEVDGFDIGIQASGDNSATISNLAVRNASAYGLYHNGGVLQVEGLVVENAPVAVFSAPTAPFSRTTLTLVNGQLRGGDRTQPAIISGDLLFARNIETRGYAIAIEARAGTTGNVESSIVDEYSSHGASKEFATNVDTSLNLPIYYQPITYDTDPQNWVNVQAYGALPGDNRDDTQAIQSAIDAAAAAGQTTLYFPGLTAPDPNWYTLDGDVTIYGTVQHIMG